MIQQIIILALFAAAIFYLVRLVVRAFRAKADCATGCGKCGVVDFQKIEQQLKEKGV